ncbi:MAG: site-specific integrase [Desulfarculus sp.]|nr:site-specific integrase [Desulfarculus sp.]
MSSRKRKLKAGVRWGYDKTVRGMRLFSPYVFLTKAESDAAEAEAVKHYLATGQTLPIGEPTSEETVLELYRRWINWLKAHRSERHAKDMASLMARALAHAPDLAGLAAPRLTIDQVEEWSEKWAGDLLERGKGRGEVNKWLRYSQTAWNAPWGKRRAQREYHHNPFQYVDRFAVEKRAKYIPTQHEVDLIRMAANGEFRLYLEILVETGARPGEGLAVTWADLRTDSLVLYTKKTAQGDRLPRRLPITEDLAGRFAAWRRAQGSGKPYVFQQEEREAHHHYVWPLKQQKSACKRAGVEYFPVGCLRHFHAVTLYEKTKDILGTQRRLGHTDVKTTQHYLASLTRS